MTSTWVGRLLVVEHHAGTPRDDEWDKLVVRMVSRAATDLRVIIFTAGGGPSPAQQARLSRELGMLARDIPVAVVSDSTAIRFLSSTLALFLNRIRTFRRADWLQAVNYLQLDQAESRAVANLIASGPAPKVTSKYEPFRRKF